MPVDTLGRRGVRHADQRMGKWVRDKKKEKQKKATPRIRAPLFEVRHELLRGPHPPVAPEVFTQRLGDPLGLRLSGASGAAASLSRLDLIEQRCRAERG